MSRQDRWFGFTLIELLVVIAVVGVLAAAIIAVVNPGEQVARGRDAQRKSSITQLGKAVEAYVVDNNGSLPTQNTSWITTLSSAGELKNAMTAVPSTRACTNGSGQNNYCYAVSGTTGYVFMFLESNGEAKKCSGGVGGASSNVYYVYDTSTGKACIKCGGGANYTAACNATQ